MALSVRIPGLVALLLAGSILESAGAAPAAPSVAEREDYVVIGWNDLGMHCINPSYKDLAILPPYNNLRVQVVRRGNPPVITTAGITLDYALVNNKTVNGKTDFWQYAPLLFGVNLPEGVGLTGNGLSGEMKPAVDHFEASGIPVLPYDDRMNWNPYQVATVSMKSGNGGLPRKTSVVIPVSDELNCAKCHAAGMDGTINIGGGTDSVEGNILAVHDYYHGSAGVADPGPDLSGARPVLCARCHSDNALGAEGDGKSKSLSGAMHGWHAQYPDAGCYDCHPGALTQCLRTGIGGMGYLGETPSCQAGLCHGGMQQVADSIDQGRQPWLEEPSCDQCHGSNYSTGPVLYRHAKGHGGLYCAACHSSPHAWWPSKQWDDNFQPFKLQKRSTAIGKCSVCHTIPMPGDNPHVTYYSGVGNKGR